MIDSLTTQDSRGITFFNVHIYLEILLNFMHFLQAYNNI